LVLLVRDYAPHDPLASVAIDKVETSVAPPVGPVTRYLLIAWSLDERLLHELPSRFGNDSKYGFHAILNQPFLGRVCGRTAEKIRELLCDLAANDPDRAKSVLHRIIELADEARAAIPETKYLATSAMGKQMQAYLGLWWPSELSPLKSVILLYPAIIPTTALHRAVSRSPCAVVFSLMPNSISSGDKAPQMRGRIYPVR
jgi:hypothetical protein